MFAGGVKQAAHIHIMDAGLQAGFHYGQVEVIDGGVEQTVGAFQDGDQRRMIGGVGGLHLGLGAVQNGSHLVGQVYIEIGDDDLVYFGVENQITDSVTAHQAGAAEDYDVHSYLASLGLDIGFRVNHRQIVAQSQLAIFTFMWNWNHFITAVIFIQNESLRILPVGLMVIPTTLRCGHSPDDGRRAHHGGVRRGDLCDLPAVNSLRA